MAQDGGGKVYGIPTDYEGTRFRSRLEARWAAFFDLIGWRWTYEPYDLAGWIPDFLIHGFVERPVQNPVSFLVEVKPCGERDELVRACDKKINAADPDRDVLLAGASPDVVNLGQLQGRHNGPVGWDNGSDSNGPYYEDNNHGPIYWDDGESYQPWSRCGGDLTIGHYHLLFRRSPCGHTGDDDDCYDYDFRRSIHEDLEYLWRKAGNQVQWRR